MTNKSQTETCETCSKPATVLFATSDGIAAFCDECYITNLVESGIDRESAREFIEHQKEDR